MNVGVLGHGFIGWGGGIDFLRIICSSLEASGQADIYLLLPTKGPVLHFAQVFNQGKRLIKRALRRNYHEPVLLTMDVVEEFAKQSGMSIHIKEIDIGIRAINHAARKYRLDALVPSFSPLSGCHIPWIGYLYDFQHKYLPYLFTEQDILARDRYFGNMLNQAKCLIVNSKTVAADINRFFPDHRSQVFSLPFSAAPRPEWFEITPPLSKYQIDSPYFMISNQFWVHKDHMTAFRAFSLVRETYPDVQLVCTGSTNDHRDPQHFSRLMDGAKNLGIANNLKVLGILPKTQQIGLMRTSLAVLQPTLFEGGPGGGSVYDALSMGVPTIVSDIPVNKELDNPLVSFFKAGDEEELAKAMLKSLSEKNVPRIDPTRLIELGIMRRKQCGMKLIEAINACV